MTTREQSMPLLAQASTVSEGLRGTLEQLISFSRPTDPRYSDFAAGQLYYFLERCKSINVLLAQGRLWDCEILMRSALECATRFIFVSVAEPAEREARIEEFCVSLPELDDLQRSEKAKIGVGNSDCNPYVSKFIGGIVLSPRREQELRARWPKQKRAALRQKWSFTKMVRDLSCFQAAEIDLRKYSSFLHGYGISSHLIHADQAAINLAWDRDQRETSERDAQIGAHAARLITEQVSILFLWWRAIAFATKIESKNINLVEDLMALFEHADLYHKAFAATQEAPFGQD